MIQRQHWFLPTICVAILLSASALWARQGVVKTKDNRTLQGEIEEKPDVVIITMHGIVTRIDRDNVASVEFFDNVEARYKDKVAKLPKNPSARDRLDLARWLFDVRAYDLALREVDEARRIDPNNAEAAALETTIMSQRRLERNRTTPGAGTTSATRTTPGTGTTVRPGTGDKTDLAEKKFLSADDINIIRQMEWRENDAVAPRVVVPADVRKRYIDLKGIPAADFAALNQLRQAYTILTDRDAPVELKRAIKVTTDPVVLADFRRRIQPLVVNTCATVACHGGHNAGKFFLFGNNTDRDDVAYTNFYILRKYKQTLNDRECLMLDPQYENLSILAQFALPPEYAELKHPELKGQTYKPMVGSKNAQSYRELVAWMKGLTTGEPNYGIRYTLPISSEPKAPPSTRAVVPPSADPTKTTPVRPPATRPATPAPAAVPPR